ncbi:MAG: S4 domain-containing protein [Pseudomonadota bacterium]
MNADPESSGPVRLDKWLWAARFFKTRSLAKQAIESGHVRYEGERSKVSREVAIGARLIVRQGRDDLEVIVRGLSDQRRGAPQARLLYEETAESGARREQARLQRQAAQGAAQAGRPTKQQRRALQRFKRDAGG